MDGIKKFWGSSGAWTAYLDEVAEEIDMSMKTARGVISSLIKKKVVLECLPEFGHEINLTKPGHSLLGIPVEEE